MFDGLPASQRPTKRLWRGCLPLNQATINRDGVEAGDGGAGMDSYLCFNGMTSR
jgi:hypothetical protein